MKTHILLIDDDKEELTFLLDALRKVPHEDGFKCSYASTPQQGIEVLRHLIPDFIFVDLKMHEANGLRFLSEVSTLPSLKKTKIYLYSLFLNDHVRETALSLGASGCIGKTFGLNKLSRELNAILSPELTPSYVASGEA